MEYFLVVIIDYITFGIDAAADIIIGVSAVIAIFYVPNLTTHHVPNLIQNVPNLTGVPNVPKIEQCQNCMYFILFHH
jgi:hypothetical protein